LRIGVRIDGEGQAHVRLSVFVNGAHAGNLCLRVSEAQDLRKIVMSGIRPWTDSFQLISKEGVELVDVVGSPGRT